MSIQLGMLAALGNELGFQSWLSQHDGKSKTSMAMCLLHGNLHFGGMADLEAEK
jgi:hypothetical protein